MTVVNKNNKRETTMFVIKQQHKQKKNTQKINHNIGIKFTRISDIKFQL